MAINARKNLNLAIVAAKYASAVRLFALAEEARVNGKTPPQVQYTERKPRLMNLRVHTG